LKVNKKYEKLLLISGMQAVSDSPKYLGVANLNDDDS
jgi:hypothetical protein